MNKQAVVIVGLILGWWGVMTMKSLATKEGTIKLSAEEIEARQTLQRSPAAAPEVAAKEKLPVPPPPVENKPPVLFEAQAELQVFANLKAKVLPSEAEKKEKLHLLRDPRVIQSIGARLMSVPPLPLGEQVVAIDFLIEALKEGDSNASERAMAAIVSDPQVENEKLPQETREQLAGIKAEVLYNWAAFSPDEQGDIARRLPGPASQKIWRNVQNTFANNLAESRGE